MRSSRSRRVASTAVLLAMMSPALAGCSDREGTSDAGDDQPLPACPGRIFNGEATFVPHVGLSFTQGRKAGGAIQERCLAGAKEEGGAIIKVSKVLGVPTSKALIADINGLWTPYLAEGVEVADICQRAKIPCP